VPLQRLHLYLTYRCQLKCRWCFTDECLGSVRDMPFELVEELHRLFPNVNRWHLNGPGETLLHHEFEKIARWLINRRAVFSFLTNGVKLDELRLPWQRVAFVSISLNEVERQAYEELTGRDRFDRVLAGLERVYRSGPRVLATFVVDDQNIGRVPEYIRFLKSYPRAKGKIVAKRENLGAAGGECQLSLETTEQFREYRKRYSGVVKFSTTRKGAVGVGLCEPMGRMLVVNGEGDVSGCCQGLGPRPELGNVWKDGRGVWNQGPLGALKKAAASAEKPAKCYPCPHVVGTNRSIL
jgi:radical SAM protein with 4Fe4S-binding SPASM domain